MQTGQQLFLRISGSSGVYLTELFCLKGIDNIDVLGNPKKKKKKKKKSHSFGVPGPCSQLEQAPQKSAVAHHARLRDVWGQSCANHWQVHRLRQAMSALLLNEDAPPPSPRPGATCS